MQVVRRRLKIKSTGQTRTFVAKQGWRTIADRKIYFRSEWEYRIGMHLQALKQANAIKDWEHEPKTFWFDSIKRGTRSYLPDFKVTRLDGTHYWIEVKGYMDAKSNTKLKRFKKYYPEEELMLIDKKYFEMNPSL